MRKPRIMAKQWQRIQDLFEQASTLVPKERTRFLTDACGGDEALRDEVESLLACDQKAPAEFMRPPEQRSSPSDSDPRIDTSVGGYHIKSVIASGGMGTVYEAIQAEPHRAIALKIMHRHVASQSALRRFRFESQILAHLRHPNIAQVFVAGMHDEGSVQVPYFAMEYVPEAHTIIEYAAEKNLGTHERLELFIHVCEAVHHGHQKGIIHRDLKPGNILVDSSGQPKVIDFGVARSTDSDIAMTTMQTDVGQIIGTLQYMSPEQCDAVPHEIDTRSDVYSLGVVLFELLTERLPYDVSHMTIHSATRLICDQPPAKPAEFDRRLRGDVETIVLRAMEKDREKRYQSSAELAEDIRRSLRGEPINARPPTAWARGVRWVAQRPVKATVSTCLGMAAIIISATYLAVWFINDRPHEIVRYKDGQIVKVNDSNPMDTDEARLIARNENVLHTWGGEGNSIHFAELVNRPSRFGGGRLALLGYTLHHDGPLRGALCAFDIDGDLDQPVWQCRLAKGGPLPDPYERGYMVTDFMGCEGWLYDVFSGQPGPEVVTMFGHRQWSQRIIRIYDLRGQVLYETWHDGPAQTCYWMKGPRLLVFAGSDATVNWDSEGRIRTAGSDPLVVFAIRPEPGHIDPGYLWRLGGDNDASLVWRRYLHLHGDPLDLGGKWALRVARPSATHAQEQLVTVITEIKGTSAQVTWNLNELGQEVSDSRWPSESYQRTRLDSPEGDPQRLPDPNDFYLDDLPPIITSQPNSQKAPQADPATP